MRTISATEFRSRCYEILDSIASGEIDKLTITKRGKPVAVLAAPASREDEIRQLHGSMRGSTIIPEDFDLTAPVLDEWLSAEDGLIHQ